MQIYTRVSRTNKEKIVFPGFLLLFLLLTVSCQQGEKSKPLQLGDTAPDFAAKDLDGQVIVLSNLQEGPIILRFFETNCRFCRADTPAFIRFFAEHKDKGLQILYIGSFYEKEETLRLFAKELGLVFPVIMDKDAILADLYQIRAYPQTIFLEPGSENTGSYTRRSWRCGAAGNFRKIFNP